MNDCPVKQGLIERILRGAASEEERSQASAHNRSACSECADTILGLPDDLEKNLVQQLLSEQNGVAPLTEEERDGIFASVAPVDECISLEAPVPPSPGAGGRDTIRFLKRAGLVALLILAPVIALSFLKPELWTGVKDGAAVSRGGVFLQFLVFSESGTPDGTPSVARGDNNGKYSGDSSLLFRFQLDGPAWLYIVRIDGHGGGELIFPDGDNGPIEHPGFYDATAEGALLVYPLSGLAASQTFCAVAYPSSLQRPGAAAAMKRALKELDRRRGRPDRTRLRHDWIDCFQIEVKEQ